MGNEIKVNEFVRTKDGVIDKVIIDYKGKCNNPNCNRKHISCEKNYYNEDEIVKHSPNLIDLIQCGDYVNGKEVIMDLQKSKEWYKSKDDFITCKDYTFEEKEIKEVVTKEQFESISYKVTKM